jgi:pimeloyl-ACP methyl ester carboxylesterase
MVVTFQFIYLRLLIIGMNNRIANPNDSRMEFEETVTMTHTHMTSPTHFVDGNGIRFAYRRFGIETGVPLLFMQHFRGGMDHWDPMVTDGIASSRPVILFNNAGVASSSGRTPNTIDAMSEQAADFVSALGISQIDILGFSIGGFIAQTFTMQHPSLVRRLILVGTGPRAGQPTQDPKVEQHAQTPDPSLDNFLYLFFAPSASSQAAGRAFWERRHLRKKDVDPPTSLQTMQGQIAALGEWQQINGERFAELKSITQPTLVVNGNNDIMIPTINSFTLSQHIPNAQLIIYPNSGHASLFQYPELFLSHVQIFLD